MNISFIRKNATLLISLALCLLYFILHYNYLEIPTEDYIGNFLPAIRSLQNLDPWSVQNKILPMYPAIIAALASLNPFRTGGDYIYYTALLFNFILLAPYFYFVYKIFERYLDTAAASFAVLFLAINPYTTVTVVNAELEMFLATITVASFYFLDKKSSLAALFASAASLTKWDAIFILPAWLFHRLRESKRLVNSLIIALFTGLPLLSWMIFMVLKHSRSTYIKEITKRGPNIYRYFIDSFYVLSGFTQWGGLHIYYNKLTALSLPVLLLILIWGAVLLLALCTGAYFFCKKMDTLKYPILCYTAGFFLIHCVYQNSKDRYVFVILWVLVLFAAIGFKEFIFPVIRKIPEKAYRFLAIFTAAIAAGYLFLLAASGFKAVLSAIILSGAFIALLLKFPPKKNTILIATFSMLLICAASLHGDQLFEHYSLRRMQFKIAAEWLHDNVPAGKKILVTEVAVIRYFSGISLDQFLLTRKLKSKNIDSLMLELRRNDISYIFIDDFYIKRLMINDKNAIDRKAALLRELRDRAPSMEELTLEKEIHFRGDHGYIYSIKQR